MLVVAVILPVFFTKGGHVFSLRLYYSIFSANGDPLPSGSHTAGNMLMIPSASVGDRAVYSCRASNSYGVVEATGTLDVTGKAMLR